jgi:hypothetical protein
MRRYRLWVARALAIAVCGALLIRLYGPEPEPSSGPVSGLVRLHGQALSSGAVVFVPVDGRDPETHAARASIAPDGSFAIVSKWRRPATRAVQYKICVLPDRRRARLDAAERDQGERRSSQVVPVSFSPDSSRLDGDVVGFGVPARYRTFETTNLEVRLGDESARIDIDLAE